MKIYVAGPMTGLPHFNFPAFDEAAQHLRRLGHTVCNPAEHDRDTWGPTVGDSETGDPADTIDSGFSLREALAYDLDWIARNADAVAVLPGWEKSKGAAAETALAHALGLLVLPWELFAFKYLDSEIDYEAVRIRPPAPPAAPKPPSKPWIIGLSGYARSGKDTVAQLLAEHGYARAAWADKLRQALLLLDPWVDVEGVGKHIRVSQVIEALGWERAKDDSPQIRQLLQRLGTDMGRTMFGEDVWVRLAIDELDGNTVFTDCRFPNECDMVRSLGGEVWRIERPEFGPVNGHISETALDGYEFDTKILNNGSIEDLGMLVRIALGDTAPATPRLAGRL